MKRSTAAVCLITASSVTITSGLVTKPLPSFTKRRSRTSTINMYLDGMDDALFSSSLLSSTAAPITSMIASGYNNIFASTSEHITSDPKLEAELLTDASHVALDLTTFFSPRTAWIRFCNVFGRILILSSDYISDHYISPDEAVFQAAMLAVSIRMFVRSVWPILEAASSQTALSVRDRRAFKQLESAVDLTVLQFKTLLTSDTLEWVELGPGQLIDLEDGGVGDMYWLHSGEVTSSLQDSSTTTTSSSAVDAVSHRMFGEVHYAKALEESRLSNQRKSSKSHKAKADDSSTSTAATTAVSETLTAGSNGAVLLRISTQKLLKLMHHDDQLNESINRLVLQSMQEKLTRTLHTKAKENNKNVVYQPNF
ncbi:hypothetical protein ACHAWO_010220 [Cyclotella atomus]|uniref:Cyclic nucleotide-binding domain-containing protein n=1 Tax=Cyclotella atomus TaxID=382360 RepID=A0ABD3NNX5_9STRA